MKKIIGQKYFLHLKVDVEADVCRCPCCDSENIDVNDCIEDGSDGFYRCGFVVCNSCGHKVECSSDCEEFSGSSVDSLKNEAINKWNYQYNNYRKNDSEEVKQLKNKINELEDVLILVKKYVGSESGLRTSAVTVNDVKSFFTEKINQKHQSFSGDIAFRATY